MFEATRFPNFDVACMKKATVPKDYDGSVTCLQEKLATLQIKCLDYFEMITINAAVSKNKSCFLTTKSYPCNSKTSILSLAVKKVAVPL